MANVLRGVRRVSGIALGLIVALPAAPAGAQDTAEPKQGGNPDAKAEKLVERVEILLGKDGEKPAASRSADRQPAADGADVRALARPVPRPFIRKLENPSDLRMWESVLVNPIREPADTTLGMTLEPVGGAARAQLELPAGEGAVVASLAGDGPAAAAGLRANDILLTAAGKPVGSVDDLTKQLKAAGESPVPLKLVRGGKTQTIEVRPVYRVTLGPLKQEKTDYYLGVNASEADETLRAHLKSLGGKGLVVNEVVAGSPAEKAGVKAHDILLKLGEKSLDSTDVLVSQVQSARDKATTLQLLRAGKPVTVEVTATPRTVEVNRPHDTLRFYTAVREGSAAGRPMLKLDFDRNGLMDKLAELPRYQEYRENSLSKTAKPGSEAEGLRSRLDGLEAEMKAVRKALEEVRDTLKSARARGRD